MIMDYDYGLWHGINDHDGMVILIEYLQNTNTDCGLSCYENMWKA